VAGLLGIAGISSCGAGPVPPPFEPVADVKQLMTSILEPAAEVYWDAVGAVEDEKGTREFAPQTAAEWDAVKNSAYLIAESGNLLMMGSRVQDAGDWMAMSRGLIDAGRRALQAAESRDKDAVFSAGGDLYDACTRCHAKYAVSLLRPNAQTQ
jgi:hypothetical protein